MIKRRKWKKRARESAFPFFMNKLDYDYADASTSELMDIPQNYRFILFHPLSPIFFPQIKI